MPKTPDKPSHAPKTITPAEAQNLTKGHKDLSLDITELDLETAKILATHEGGLILNGLTHIDVPVAEVLAKHKGGLSLDGLTQIDVPVAEALAKCEGYLSLDGITQIDVPVAEALAKHEGYLEFFGLTQIDVPVAEALAHTHALSLGLTKIDLTIADILRKCKDHLSLNTLTQIDVPVAEALAKHEGYLEFFGLTQIDVPVAEALAKHEGELILGLTQIDVPVAEALAKHEGSYLYFGGLKHIDVPVAEALAKYEDALDLSGLTHIDVPVAEALAKHKGNLYLDGLTQIDVPVAEALAKHKGDLSLDGLTQIDVPLAEALAKCEGDLYLDGLTQIDVPVAEALAKHEDDLYLNGLKHIDTSSAEALISHRGELHIEGYNLLKISRQAYKLLNTTGRTFFIHKNLEIIEEKTQIASLKLPEEAADQIKEWLPLFNEHPNFKDVVAGESGQLCGHLKGKGVTSPEHFYNLNASRNIQPLFSDFLEFIGQLPNGFGLKTFYDDFEREYLKKFENTPEFIEIYKDEVVQAMTNHLTGIIESSRQGLQKKSDVSLDERKAFFESKLNEPGLPDKIKNRFRRDLEKLLSSQTGDEASDTAKRMKDAENLLARFEGLHFIRPEKAGFKLASRNVKELTLGDECSDCTSATISGMNFWTVPTWLTDPGFNFLLQYDENGKLAHKFGVVWEVKESGEAILTIDSAEVGNSQKTKSGMYEKISNQKKEKKLIESAIKFIYDWMHSMGLDPNNIYANTFSNTGTKEFEDYPKKTLFIAKLGKLEAVENILKKHISDYDDTPGVYLQSLAENLNPGEIVNIADEHREKIYSDVEKALTQYLSSDLSDTDDYRKVKDLLTSARENPDEAARRMRIFLVMEAQSETKKLLSVNGVRIDLLLANNKLTLERYFNAMLGRTEVIKERFVQSTLYHLSPNASQDKKNNEDENGEDDSEEGEDHELLELEADQMADAAEDDFETEDDID